VLSERSAKLTNSHSSSKFLHSRVDRGGIRAPTQPRCHCGGVLRILREPLTGRPARGTRLLALLIAVLLLAGSAPVLLPAISRLLGLL